MAAHSLMIHSCHMTTSLTPLARLWMSLGKAPSRPVGLQKELARTAFQADSITQAVVQQVVSMLSVPSSSTRKNAMPKNVMQVRGMLLGSSGNTPWTNTLLMLLSMGKGCPGCQTKFLLPMTGLGSVLTSIQ